MISKKRKNVLKKESKEKEWLVSKKRKNVLKKESKEKERLVSKKRKDWFLRKEKIDFYERKTFKKKKEKCL